MSLPKPLATVIIPHLNQQVALEACLDSLDAQSVDRSVFEVVVVDNGSDTLPDLAADRRPNVQLLVEPQPGPGLARNRGVDAARGDILCFIDADCRADRHWLERALGALASAPASTVFGGDVRIWRDDAAKFAAIEAYESVFAYRFKMYIEKQGYSGTGNLVVQRADFAKVGPFRGLEVAEDVDWGARARAAGMTIRYEPGMIVYHPARSSLRELFVKWDRHLHHERAAARAKPLWRLRWLARACLILVSPLVDAGKVVVSDRIEGWPAKLKAIAVLAAVRSYRAWRMLCLMFTNQGIVWNRAAQIDSVKTGS
jgi:glycosyltransferase involved in cell wall biosynthesis